MKAFSHPGTTEKVLFNINYAIENAVAVSRHEWKYVADVELNLDPSLPEVPCLPGEFNQVILNLIVNAAHAIADKVQGSGADGRIILSTTLDAPFVEIIITDTGTGIPEEIISRIFDPFFTTKEVGKGTGQGLAITHDVITKKHQGTIRVSSVVGEGTTFTIQLPLGARS
jgi:signal transduction histidine kinase